MTLDTIIIKCERCNETVENNDELTDVQGTKTCNSCLELETFVCEYCDDTYFDDDARNVQDTLLCENCFADNAATCRCGNYTELDDNRDNIYFCDQCNEYRCDNCACNCNDDCDGDESFDTRNPIQPTRKRKHKNGRIIKSPRTFGVELEVLIPNENLDALTRQIDGDIGIVTDGSITSGYDYTGVEIVTPKLNGSNGEKKLKKICEVLKNLNATVNSTCGLHLHLDGIDILSNDNLLIKMFRFYVNNDDAFFTLASKSRYNNSFCKPLKNGFNMTDVNNVWSIKEIEEMYYKTTDGNEIINRKKQRYDNTRYYGFNFHSLLSNGHIEIRLHNATINDKKILFWINLNQKVLDEFTKERNELTQIKELYPDKKMLRILETVKMPVRQYTYFKSRINKFYKLN